VCISPKKQHRHTLCKLRPFLIFCETKWRAANVSQTDPPPACVLYLSRRHQRSNAMYNGGPGGQLPPGQGAGGNPTGQPNNLNAAAGGVPPAGAPAAAQQHHGMLYICPGFCIALVGYCGCMHAACGCNLTSRYRRSAQDGTNTFHVLQYIFTSLISPLCVFTCFVVSDHSLLFVLCSTPDRRRPQFRIIRIRMPQQLMPHMVVSSQPENGLNWMIMSCDCYGERAVTVPCSSY
jgi:hypothetical protein